MSIKSFILSVFGIGKGKPSSGGEVEVVAKVSTEGVMGAVSFLGPDGRNYVLYYRNSGGDWTPVPLVNDFPA